MRYARWVRGGGGGGGGMATATAAAAAGSAARAARGGGDEPARCDPSADALGSVMCLSVASVLAAEILYETKFCTGAGGTPPQQAPAAPLDPRATSAGSRLDEATAMLDSFGCCACAPPKASNSGQSTVSELAACCAAPVLPGERVKREGRDKISLAKDDATTEVA